MSKKRKRNQKFSPSGAALGLVGTGAVLGVGAAATQQIPGGSAYTGGLQAAGRMLPVAGSITGAGIALNLLGTATQQVNRLGKKRR